jgi:hypothetical protein
MCNSACVANLKKVKMFWKTPITVSSDFANSTWTPTNETEVSETFFKFELFVLWNPIPKMF